MSAAPDARREDRRILAAILRFVRDAAGHARSLPGELELAEKVGCSRKQVRDVLASLEQQGVVRRRQGAATEVDPVAMRMSVRFEDQIEHEILLQQLGYEAAVEVLEITRIRLPEAVAALLMAETGAPGARVVKRWLADGAVAMVAVNTVPFDGDVPLDDLGDSVYEAAPRVFGEAIAWEVATPSAEILAGDDARLLEQPAGCAVLTLDTVGIGLSGRRLFHARELHDPRIISYSMMRTIRPPQIFSTARYQF